MVVAKKLASGFFYQKKKKLSWLWSCKQGHNFCASTRTARPCGPVFPVSCCSVGSLYVFPQNASLAYQALQLGHELQGQNRGCSQGVTPPCSCLALQQHKFECSPSSESAEWQQRDCHSFTNHLECSTSSVLLYPNVLGANGEGCGEMLPSTPTASTCPKLLLIGDPVVGAGRLSK